MAKENKQERQIKSKEQNRESIFDIVIEMLYVALVFLTPIIFDRRVGIVFSNTKSTTMRIVIIAILTIWAVKIMLKQEHRFIRTPLDWPIISYLLACTIATLTSVHVLTSLMGFYGRYEGLVTLYIYGLLFFISTNFIKTKEQIMRVMYTVIIAGVSMSIYGVIQRMGLDPYAWGGVVTWERVIGTIGQPNFMAAYVDMAFIIGLALFLNLKEVDWKAQYDWRKVYDIALLVALIGGLALIYIGVIFTQSRGGLLGLYGGASLFFVITKREYAFKKWRELSVLFLAIFIISVVVSLNSRFSPFGRFAGEAAVFEEQTPRVNTILKPSSGLSRVETWKSAYKIIADYPLFGIGQEVLKMIYPRYETNMFRFYEAFHVKQDRCHNEVCDMGVTRGGITLFIYVWILGTFYYLGVKVVKGDYDPQMKLFVASFLGASAAYLIQNQFSFGVVAITSFLWVMIGLTASIYVKAQPTAQTRPLDISNMPWLIFAVTLIIAFYMSYLSTIQFRADMHYKEGKSLADARRIDNALAEYQKSLKISPYEGGTWTYLGIATLNLAQIAQNAQMVDKAIQIFGIANKIDPYNADNFHITGRAYFLLSLPGGANMDKVIDEEEKAIKIDPYYAEAYQVIGAVYERQGKLKEAAQMYEKTVEINPQIADAITSLSGVYVRMGQPNKVVEIYKKFLERYPGNPVFQENLAAVYVKQNRINDAVAIYEDMISIDAKNVTALVNLGFMSAKIGRTARAKECFESTILIDPKNVNAHNGLGLVYLQYGQKEKAKEEFNQSLMVDPNNEYAKQMLGNIK